ERADRPQVASLRSRPGDVDAPAVADDLEHRAIDEHANRDAPVHGIELCLAELPRPGVIDDPVAADIEPDSRRLADLESRVNVEELARRRELEGSIGRERSLLHLK